MYEHCLSDLNIPEVMDLLQIVSLTWFRNTNHLAVYVHPPNLILFQYQFLPVLMDNYHFALLLLDLGTTYHMSCLRLSDLVNLSVLWKHIYMLWHFVFAIHELFITFLFVSFHYLFVLCLLKTIAVNKVTNRWRNHNNKTTKISELNKIIELYEL